MTELFTGFTPPEELVLKPIQDEILNQVRTAFTKSKRVILQAATASGKTAIAAKIFQNATKREKRCLFICDRIVLVNQTSDEFGRWGIRHGVVMGKDHPLCIPDRPVQIASAATLLNRKIDQFDIIIQDEAHALHKGAIKAFDANPDALILGLTASPYTKGLGKIFETYIQPFTIKQLTEKGLLCPYDVYGPCPIDLSNVKTTAGEYNNKDLGEAANKTGLTADIVDTYLKLAKGKKTIVFSTNVAHGRALQKQFMKKGISAKEINAYLPKAGPESSTAIIEEFRQNIFTVLISVSIIIKGFSVSDVEVIQLATATKSMIKLTQAVGRGTRLFPGKEKCIVLDHGKNFERLGFPDEYVFDELDDGKKHESSNKQQERPEQLPKVCASCAFLKPPGVHICPACGFKPELVQDVEVADGQLEKIARKARKEYTIEEKQEFLGGLNRHAAKKGMKIHRKGFYGWALYKFQDKFGCRPSSKMSWSHQCNISEEVKKFIQHGNIKFAKGKDKKEKKIANNRNCEIIKMEGCPKCGSKSGVLVQAKPFKLECLMCGEFIRNVTKESLDV